MATSIVPDGAIVSKCSSGNGFGRSNRDGSTSNGKLTTSTSNGASDPGSNLPVKASGSRCNGRNTSNTTSGTSGKGLIRLVRNAGGFGYQSKGDKEEPPLPNRKYLTIRQASNLLSVHPQTLRQWTRQGLIRCYRTIGGSHRRFDRDELLRVGLGIEGGTNGNAGIVPLALVARVSGSKQAKKSGDGAECSSLEHQVKRVEDFTRDRFGDTALAYAKKYYAVRSGLNHDHKTLVSLIQDILEGKFRNGYIVAQDPIRCMRFGIGIFRVICEFGGCQILYTHPHDLSDEKEDLHQSILSILNFFTSKANGLRNSRINGKKLPQEVLAEAFHLKRSGYSDRTICRVLAERGFLDTDKKTQQQKPYHHAMIGTRLRRCWASLTALYPETKSETSFDRFFGERIKITDNQKQGITSIKIMEEYRRWATAKGEPTISVRAIGLSLKKRGLKRVSNTQHLTEWKSLSLLEAN